MNGGGEGWRFLLYTAALSVAVFGAQTQFRFIAFKVKQLLGVERPATLPDDTKKGRNIQSETRFM